MKKKLLLVGISLVLLMGLQACSTTSATTTSRQALAYPPKLEAAIEETGAKIVILVTEKGELSFFDPKGTEVPPCSLPGSESNDPMCKGLKGGQSVVGIKALPFLETEGSGCITIGPNASGQYYQYCW